MNIAVITISDRASKGEYKDQSGPYVKEILEKSSLGQNLKLDLRIVPDEEDDIVSELASFIEKKYDFIFTTGGTGVGPRDITPEATRKVIDKEIPGIAEAMRAYSMKFTKNAVLSRAIAGMAGNTMIVNLPGNPKAVKEILDFILPILEHAHHMIYGRDVH